MQAFEYTNPKTKEEAVGLLADAWGKTEILAGGTDLLSLMKDFITTPQRVVDLKSIKELRGISHSPDTAAIKDSKSSHIPIRFRIGGLVTFEELLKHDGIRQMYPGLVQAAEGVTSPQIRNRGTVGGDLCQRPRCWYFRGGFGLLAKDEQGKSLVLEGDNRYHAILGNSGPAYFVNPSSLAPALIALGARVRLFGPRGARDLPVEQFFVAPKSDKDREYALKPNEIVTEVLLPPAEEIRSATYEVRQREALDWPLATASVALKLKGKTIESARVVLGHVAPLPWHSPEAERVLIGKPLNEEIASAAGQAAVQSAKPLSRNAYKVQLARVAVKRALLQAAG